MTVFLEKPIISAKHVYVTLQRQDGANTKLSERGVGTVSTRIKNWRQNPGNMARRRDAAPADAGSKRGELETTD